MDKETAKQLIYEIIFKHALEHRGNSPGMRRIVDYLAERGTPLQLTAVHGYVWQLVDDGKLEVVDRHIEIVGAALTLPESAEASIG